ncbi:MAG: MATE family efflux transporter [Clostridiales bacterium]|jgi:putative MATE family efflux protein|nr:MATE family efflux transporter [Clostridiales bacterium]
MIKDRSFYRTIFRLSLPAAFQGVINLLVVMADNLMVTTLDTQGLAFAAVVQSNSITNLALALLTGLANGSIVLVSQYWGKKQTGRIRDITAAVMLLSILVAGCFVLLLHILTLPVLRIVINRNEVEAISLAARYLPLISFSYLPYAVTACLIAMLKGVEIVRVTVYTTITSLFANIGLNYLLIFGKLGLPAMGVQGAALATVLARVIEMLLVVWYVHRKQHAVDFKLGHIKQQAGWAWQDYARFGLPVGITDAQWALVGMLKMVIIGQLGIVMSNAVGVTDSLFNLGTLFTFSLAGGAAVMVGKAVGAGNIKLVKEYSRTIQIMFLFIGIFMAALVFLIRKPFISLYGLTDQAFDLANQMVLLCTLTLIGTSYHASCFVGINRGAGDNKFVMMVDMVCGWLIVLPAAFLGAFVLKLPLAWVYFLTRVDQTFKWIIANRRLKTNKWIHHVTRPEQTEEAPA